MAYEIRSTAAHGGAIIGPIGVSTYYVKVYRTRKYDGLHRPGFIAVFE